MSSIYSYEKGITEQYFKFQGQTIEMFHSFNIRKW